MSAATLLTKFSVAAAVWMILYNLCVSEFIRGGNNHSIFSQRLTTSVTFINYNSVKRYVKFFHIDESCESTFILCWPQEERTAWLFCIYIFIKIHFEKTLLFYFLTESCSNELLLQQVLSTSNQWSKFTQMWLNFHLTGFIDNWNWTWSSHRSNIRLDESTLKVQLLINISF